MLSDAELVKRISARIKELRLKQNISREEVSLSSGVSMSSIARIEDGEIKSFASLLRIMRTLGQLDVLAPLIEEVEISPAEYYKLKNSVKKSPRKRASKTKKTNKPEEDSQW